MNDEKMPEAVAELPPYRNQLEFVEGLRKVVDARRRYNELKYDDEDPSCKARPKKRTEEEHFEELDQRELAVEQARVDHLARCVAARSAGISLPLDELCAERGLDEADRCLLESLLVISSDLGNADRVRSLTCGQLARTAADWDAEQLHVFLPKLLPGGALFQTGICQGRTTGERVSEWQVRIVPDVLCFLLGSSETKPSPAPAREIPADIIGWLAQAGVELTPATAQDLVGVWGLIACRDTVMNRWGFAGIGNLPATTSILFSGPSGTGKTLTARHLASALSRELRLVSCTDVLSMWVGESEKGLRRCFEEAQKSGAVLLFDEADALFGRRGDVLRAGERMFNAEVNAALIELERFPGICILTTNHTDLLDPAVLRRLRGKVRFTAPDAETRSRIWRCHVPKEAPLASDVDFVRLGSDYELTGGQIVNAVTAAAARAAARLSAAPAAMLTMADFRSAAKGEAESSNVTNGMSRSIGFN